MEKFRASRNSQEKSEILEDFVMKIEELENGNFQDTPGLKNAVIKSFERTEYSKISDHQVISDHPLQAVQPSPLLALLKEMHPDLSTTVLGDTEIPTNFRSVMAEYAAAQSSAVLFDESYRKFFKISGRDREIVADHFVTLGVKKLTPTDFRFSCLLDSKGLILDLCQIGNSNQEISVLTYGVHASSVTNFLSQYLAFARSGGLEVEISDQPSQAVFSVLGPRAAEALVDLGGRKFLTASSDPVDFHSIRNDECVEIFSLEKISIGLVVRSNAVADCFTFVVSPEHGNLITREILTSPTITPAGLYAFDSLRMERGFPRAGVDVTSLTSPVKAALVWMLDQEKLRDRKLFGWKPISAQLAKAPSHRRVGFVADQFVHAGCRILSAPHRRLIGEVTSCAWSPILKKRLCQGFLKPEYAQIDKQIFVSVPFDLPEDLTKDVRSRFLKQGMQRRKFRRLVTCTVVEFPIEDRKLQSRAAALAGERRKRKRLNPTADMKRQEGRLKARDSGAAVH